MALKIHLIETTKQIVDGKIKEGVTACGEPFYKHPTTDFGDGHFQAVRRIGGLRAVEVSDFEEIMFDKNICVKCRTKHWNS